MLFLRCQCSADTKTLKHRHIDLHWYNTLTIRDEDRVETQIAIRVSFSAGYLPRHSASAGSLAIMLGGSPPTCRSNENAMRLQTESLYCVGLRADKTNFKFECLHRTGDKLDEQPDACGTLQTHLNELKVHAEKNCSKKSRIFHFRATPGHPAHAQS